MAFVVALFALAVGVSACGGGGTTATSGSAASASLAGAVIDGKVKNATVTVYSDQAMTTQVGSGTTDASGNFNVTLNVATAPDPVYIKSTGGIDLDTGLPAPDMFFVGNTAGTNKLTSFNVTPLTTDVFNRVALGDTLANAQTNSMNATGVAQVSDLYGDPTANTAIKTAMFKRLASGTMTGRITAGSYTLFAIIGKGSDLGATSITGISAGASPLVGGANFITADISVDASGVISGSTGGGAPFYTGKIVGSSIVFNVVDSTTTPTDITRVVGHIGLHGSIAGNFTRVFMVGGTPTTDKGVFVASIMPATGASATGLQGFVDDFYDLAAGGSTMNFIARDVFITGGTIPRFSSGQTTITAASVTAGTLTASDMTVRQDLGSTAGATGTLTFTNGAYVLSGGTPTNLLVLRYSAGPTTDIYLATAVGLRRGVYFAVAKATNLVDSVGDAYMSRSGAIEPSPFSLGASFDVTLANIHPAMPGLTRAVALLQGLSPMHAATLTMPAALTAGTMRNGYWDTTTGGPELMVFQGSMLAMKQDANDNFAENRLTGTVDDHMRLVEFYDSGAMQGEETMGGTLPGGTPLPGSTSTNLRDYPSTLVGFVQDTTAAAAPSFTGTLNFLARTMYATDYTAFATAYIDGTLTITTAPTATATGTATLSYTPAGGTGATVPLTIDAVPSTLPGVYHMHGALSGGRYVDITWPIGGTKAVYALSSGSTGNVQEVGEAYLTP